MTRVAPGRRSALQQALCEAVRLGQRAGQAARALGLSRSTVRAWCRQGRRARRGKFRAFLTALEKAEAECAARRLERIRAAADKGTWQAAAWMLERRWPEAWSLQAKEIRELFRRVRELERSRNPGGRLLHSDQPRSAQH
jgi:hypothetical protein